MKFTGKIKNIVNDLMLRGSSDYNTYEMSKLIDGCVQEAKYLGIETLTPEELERMKVIWRK